VLRLRASVALSVIAALALAFPASAAPVATRVNSDSKVSGPKVDRTYALVQLSGAPLSTASATKPSGGKKINFTSTATKSYRAELSALRNQYKSFLRTAAPNARVTKEFDISLNAVGVQLNGHTLAQISASPLVVQAQYAGLYYKVAHEDPDLEIIDALEAWTRAGGPANAGAGVKVAIVDSGISTPHPCFSDAGYPAQTQLGDRRFTNNKVIAAKVFYNKASVRGFTAEAIDSHGTHVAGTVACNLHTPAAVSGVDIPYDPSGVAPRALLGNYNVFPADVANARSEDIVDALEEAYEDGFDVANMSLGGGSRGVNDLLAMAVDDLDRANMVVAVAAGNSGPGHFTIESPGKAARALTAGASTVPHFVGAPVTAGTLTVGAASGEFATVSADLTAPLAVVTSAPLNAATGLSIACAGSLTAGSLTGKIALISRGVCTFSEKIRTAQQAGAVAVLVTNNVAGDPVAMASDGTPNQPTVPAYQVGLEDGKALKGKNGVATTIDSTLAYFSTSNVDIMAGFSSQGPTDVDFRVKPDVVAPGVNVLSSVPANACPAAERPCWAFFQGTSMATPHLAGSAAVVRGLHPTWDAWQIRSAIVNTAERGVLKAFNDGTTIVTDPNIEGAGRENLLNAVNASVTLDPVSVSFGAVSSGSGNTLSRRVTLKSTGAAGSFAVSVGSSTGTGVSYSVSPSNVALTAGGTATVTITMRAAKGATFGDHQAWLEIGNAAHAAVYTLIK
jgi:minor extracellular serine protease Vpr